MMIEWSKDLLITMIKWSKDLLIIMIKWSEDLLITMIQRFNNDNDQVVRRFIIIKIY
jgi:hypothetical protein